MNHEEFRDIKGPKRQHLIEERKKAGLKQSQLAEMIGCSTAMISHLENGRMKPSLEVSLSLERLFGQPSEVLFPDL